jgi:hypothetical protein
MRMPPSCSRAEKKYRHVRAEVPASALVNLFKISVPQ